MSHLAPPLDTGSYGNAGYGSSDPEANGSKKAMNPPPLSNPYRDQHIDRFVTPGGNPVDNSQPGFPVYHRTLANPSSLGLLAFGATTFMLACFNVRARGIVVENAVLGMLMGYGGLVMLLAGMWEFATGNTFGATSISSYGGGFFLSLAVVYIPQFGVVAAYLEQGLPGVEQLANALGIYFATWAAVSFIFLLASLGASVAVSGLFVTIMMQFILLSANEFTGILKLQTAAGAFGFMTAAFAFYAGLAGMLTPDTAWFTLPVGDLHPHVQAAKAEKRKAAREEREARKNGGKLQ